MLLVHHLHYTFDLHLPLPVALIYNNNQTATSAWYVPTVSIQPVQMGDWIGAVAAGASVNFNQISFNPHGNGTHTESVGHITPHFLPLTDIYKQFHHLAQLITVQPLQQENDFVIDAAQLAAAFNPNFPCEALLIRTLPNDNYYKQHHNYSNQNPPYLSKDAAHWLVEHNILHLLIDLPSVDKEKDDGELSAHKIFWDYPALSRANCTITELFFANDTIKDGFYLLNLQIAAFLNDACPSFPVLYAVC